MSNNHIGGSFDDFLENEGLLAQSQAEAVKRVLAWQIETYMRDNNVTKTTFAQRMNTSRGQLNRLLDPENTSVSLTTMSSAAAAMGKHLTLQIA
jgi:hypothetical protein